MTSDPAAVRRRRGRVLAGLGVLWALLVYLGAAGVHRPEPEWVLSCFWPPIGPFAWDRFFLAAGRHAGALAALAGFDLVWVGVGSVALGFLRMPRRRGAFRLGVELAAGSALLGGAALALALAGLAYAGVFAGAMAVAVAGAVRAGGKLPWAGFSEGRKAVAEFPWPLRVFALAMGLAAAVSAAAPEVTVDALRFTLELPRRALLLHRLVPEAHLPLTWTPWLPQAIGLPVAALAGQAAVKLLNVQSYVLVALLLAEWLGGKRETRAAAPYAAAAWLALLNVPVLAHTAMTDMQSACWILLAAIAQLRWRSPVLAGLLWGGALGFKYQAGIFLAAALLAEAGPDVRFAGRMGTAALAGSGIWFVRNLLFTGNPLAPFFMPGGSGAEAVPAFFFRVREWLEIRSLTGWLSSPFPLVSRPSMWDSLLSPLLVAALPLAFLRAVPARVKVFLAVSLAGWSWVVGNNGRYLLAAAPILLFAAGTGAARLLAGRSRGWIGRALIGLAIGYEACASAHWNYFIFNPAGVFLGKESRETHLARMLAPRPLVWETGARLRGIAGRTERYYLFGISQAHYWPGLPLIDAEYTPARMAGWARESEDARRLRVKLKQAGIRLLVCLETTAPPEERLLPAREGWTPAAARTYRDFLAGHARRRLRLGTPQARFAVYEFLPVAGSPEPVPRPLPLGETMPVSP